MRTPRALLLASAVAALSAWLSFACGGGSQGSSSGSDEEVLAGGAAGAGGSGGTPCNEKPQVCEAGKVCWVVTQAGDQFSCVNASKTAKLGDDCTPLVSSLSPCGEGSACVAAAAGSKGKCRAFCGSEGSCSAGEQCAAVTFGEGSPDGGAQPSIDLCLPTLGGGAAGASGASGAAGASGASGGSG